MYGFKTKTRLFGYYLLGYFFFFFLFEKSLLFYLDYLVVLLLSLLVVLLFCDFVVVPAYKVTNRDRPVLLVSIHVTEFAGMEQEIYSWGQFLGPKWNSM